MCLAKLFQEIEVAEDQGGRILGMAKLLVLVELGRPLLR